MTGRFAELQDRLQRAIVAGGDAMDDVLPNGARESRDVLLGVYRNAYVLRLVEIVRNDHELLHAYMGDESLNEMARGYVAAYPSHARNARWYTQHVPKYLFETAPYRDHRQVGELALLEKTLNDVFDAPDAPILTLADLAAIPVEDWERLSFTPQPATVRLGFETNATDIWRALKSEQSPPEVERRDPVEQVLVWRRDLTASFRTLGTEEAMLWDEAAKGVRFGVLCELAATYDNPETAPARVAGCLQGWIQSGALRTAAAGG